MILSQWSICSRDTVGGKETMMNLQAGELIESQQLLQYVNRCKEDYLVKQPLPSQRKNYLDIAHLFPGQSRYGGMNNGGKGGSGQLLNDGYKSGSRGSDLGKLLKNEYTASTVLGGGMYLPVNSSKGYESLSGKSGKYALEMEEMYCN